MHIYFAGGMVFAALVFDVLDGRIARWRQKTSGMGRELDSLADVISFGVAPAVIGYGCGMFAVPDEPIVEARMERFKNPLFEYQVPQAVLLFRQGFGRLIRTKTDRGAVVVLDSRIMTKGYGKWFLRSVPKYRITDEREEFRKFFEELRVM